MIVAYSLSLACLTLAVVCATLFLANFAHAGFSTVSLWLLCLFLVLGIVGLTLLAHGYIAESKAIADTAGNEQTAADQNAPVAPPGNAANAAVAERIDRQAANGGIGGQQNSHAAAGWWHNGLQLAFAGAVAAATILLAIFGAYQLSAIRHQIRLAEASVEHMRLEQRAWVGFGQPSLLSLEPGKHARAQIGIKNSGHTPAEIVSMTGDFFFWESPDSVDELVERVRNLSPSVTRESVLAPGGVHTPQSKSRDVVTESDLQLCKDGGLTLYYIGFIKYRTLGKLRNTIWCFSYDFDRQDFYAHTKHNHMD